MMKMSDNFTKIAFDVVGSSDSGFEVERLWAGHCHGNLYEIYNSPFQVYGISLGDKVFVKEHKGELFFSGVSERGRHSTYRVRLLPRRDHDYFLQYWDALAALGCKFEGASGEQRLYAIDIPDPERVADVYCILQKHEDDGVWEFEEAHYFDPMQ